MLDLVLQIQRLDSEEKTVWDWKNGSDLRTFAAFAEDPSMVHSIQIGHPQLPITPTLRAHRELVCTGTPPTQHIHTKEKN